MGLFLGLRREEAARFSFLMSVPIIGGAGALKMLDLLGDTMSGTQILTFVAGFITSAIVGYVTIRFLLEYLVNHSLRIFAYYRFALAMVVTALLLIF